MHGGTFEVGQNMMIGADGYGEWNQDGGTATFHSWTVVGRFGATSQGKIDVSGGTFLKPDGGNLNIGEDGAGILTISGSGLVRVQTGIEVGLNTGSSGTVNLNGGTLETTWIGGRNAGTSTINFNGGTLRGIQNDATLLSGRTAAYVLAGDAIIDTPAGITNTIAQDLLDGGGGGGLTKQGTGKLTLSGTHTYTGQTDVQAGELSINGSITGGGGLIAPAGAVVSGNGTVSGASTVNGTLAPGNSIGTFAVTGDLTLGGTLDVEVDGTGAGLADLLNVSGVFDITGATVNFIALNGLDDPVYVFASYGSVNGSQFSSVQNLPSGYSIDYAYGGNQMALIPEPGTFGLMAALAAVLWIRRRLRG